MTIATEKNMSFSQSGNSVSNSAAYTKFDAPAGKIFTLKLI